MNSNINSQLRGFWHKAAAVAALTIVSVAAQPTAFFPLNEGEGTQITDTAGGLVGVLGIAQNPETDTPTLQDDSPSGAAGDRSLLTQGEGFLVAQDDQAKALDLIAGPITTEMWINIDPNSPGGTEGFVSYGGSYKVGLKAGELVWTLLGQRDVTNTTAFFPVGAWTHVATAWERGVGVTFYVNGEPTFATVTNLGRAPLNNVLSIGSEGTGNNVVAGIDRLRIHNTLLTPEELDNVAATPKPVFAGGVAAYNFNETALPATNSAPTALPAESSVPLLPLLTGPVWTNNSPSGLTNDYSLLFPNPRRTFINDEAGVVTLNAENGDYTLEAWVNIPQGFTPPLTSAGRMIVFTHEANPGFSLSVHNNLTVHTTAFAKKDQTSQAPVPNDGQWHHIAVVHEDGVAFHFYVDGVLLDTEPYTAGAGARTNPRLAIGSAVGGANAFTGMIDRPRYTNRALTAAELDSVANPNAPAAVRLNVQLNGSQVVLSWPGSAEGYTLEATGDLRNPQWATVAAALVDGQYRATVETTESARFFRLRK